jgi:hypothetical protein
MVTAGGVARAPKRRVIKTLRNAGKACLLSVYSGKGEGLPSECSRIYSDQMSTAVEPRLGNTEAETEVQTRCSSNE